MTVTETFEALPVWLNFVLFVGAALMVWAAGTRLSLYADAISDRKRIGKALMGLVFLAAATELPELVTTITASIQGNAALVLNNMFGGITLQTAILVAADVVVVHATLTFYPRKPTPALEATLLIFLLAMLLGATMIGDRNLFANVGIGSATLFVTYGLTLFLLRRYERNAGWLPVKVPERAEKTAYATARDLDRMPLPGLYGRAAAAIAVIFFAGVMLVFLAEALAIQTDLGASFVGVTLLAAATSLPELSTTVAAARIGAYTMAISNVFGSNLIMVALILPADIFYRPGLLLNQADGSAKFALISGIAVTAVYITGLLLRSNRRVLGIGLDSLVVLVLYLASIWVLYHMR